MKMQISLMGSTAV